MRASCSTPCCTTIDTLEAVAIPELADAKAHVAVAVLKTSQPAAAGAAPRPLPGRPRQGPGPLPRVRLSAGRRRRLERAARDHALRRLDAAAGDREDDHRLRRARGRPRHARLQRLRHPRRPDEGRRRCPTPISPATSEFMNQVQPLFPQPARRLAERAGHPREEGQPARHPLAERPGQAGPARRHRPREAVRDGLAHAADVRRERPARPR